MFGSCHRVAQSSGTTWWPPPPPCSGARSTRRTRPVRLVVLFLLRFPLNAAASPVGVVCLSCTGVKRERRDFDAGHWEEACGAAPQQRCAFLSSLLPPPRPPALPTALSSLSRPRDRSSTLGPILTQASNGRVRRACAEQQSLWTANDLTTAWGADSTAYSCSDALYRVLCVVCLLTHDHPPPYGTAINIDNSYRPPHDHALPSPRILPFLSPQGSCKSLTSPRLFTASNTIARQPARQQPIKKQRRACIGQLHARSTSNVGTDSFAPPTNSTTVEEDNPFNPVCLICLASKVWRTPVFDAHRPSSN